MTDRARLIVVPTEGQVEACAVRGERALTRIALRERLLRVLAPDVTFASSLLVRAALADVMASRNDPVLERLRALGGVAWERTIDAMREASRVVRRCNVEGSLGEILAALDAKLDAAKLVDPARGGVVLARAIEGADVARVRSVIGATAVVARWIVRWDPSDAAWWRALSNVVETSIEMPWIDWPIDVERTPGPLETLLDDVALVTGEPPHPALLEGVPLGDATGACDPERVAIAACSDAEAQARAAGSAIIAALANGSPVDRVAIAFANPEEDVVAPVRRVLDEIGIPFHDGVGSAPAASGIVAVALDALGLGARGLPRLEVAALLRSRYLAAATVTGIGGWAGRRALDDLARALESTPSAGGVDATERLTRTAGKHAELARHVASILAHASVTRAEHVAASRRILGALGFAPSAPTLAHDNVLVGLDRTELAASAADARGWEALRDALDAAERAAAALAESPCPHETFVHELRTALGEPEAASAAGRAGAVRLVRPVDLAGGEWDLLVVLEASDEALDRPRTIAGPLLTESALARLRQRQPDRAPRDLGREHLLAEIVLAAERARKIVLAHRTRGFQGEELAPAALVRAAQQSGASREVVRAGDRPRTQREHRLALVAAGAPEIAAALAPSATRRALLELSRERWHAGRSDAKEAAGLVSGPALAVLRSETGGARPMSVTMLERFARCAFQGYAATLAASGDELARETPDAREEGNLVHEALRIAFEAIAEDLRKRPRDAPETYVEKAIAAIDAHLNQAHAAPLRNIALLRAKAEVEQVVRAAVEEEWWDFVAAEQPIAIALGEIQLRGKMDRVDRAHGEPERIRVVDYKRRQDHVPASELGKKRLQLLVYGVAAARDLHAKHFDGLYLPTRAAGEPLPPSFREAWLQLASESAVEARVVEIMSPIRDGDVTPSPGPHCPTCPFDGACRKPRFVLLEADGPPAEGS